MRKNGIILPRLGKGKIMMSKKEISPDKKRKTVLKQAKKALDLTQGATSKREFQDAVTQLQLVRGSKIRGDEELERIIEEIELEVAKKRAFRAFEFVKEGRTGKAETELGKMMKIGKNTDEELKELVKDLKKKLEAR